MPDVASKLIAEAATGVLRPLGLHRRGRSRVWIDDHGWWLLNVEFQPSGQRKGCYLNVGHQHLWVRRDHLVFGEHERPLGGSAFLPFEGDEDSFRSELTMLVGVAADAVERRRSAHGEGSGALRRVAEGKDDLDGGIAAAILGDTELAARRLRGSVHPAYREQAAHYIESGEQAGSVARGVVAETRRLLGLTGDWKDWQP